MSLQHVYLIIQNPSSSALK